ncbi:protein LIKE COV 1-like [Olea europaea var. sylvestris]|uniref:protein LIKE COV 1-like n=1 Tax=Olea europaea var. sylvestris TaxID=158386 RepID=UPI000C1CF957|nr:protein LIKE COV 1-like [Olea europaea var. sylvestris]XP_022897357.1 protein LIKE COV 1-like [Olea europaea var. sylvestris]
MSSWLGTSVLSLGKWFIKHMPFVHHIYNASKQISAAISPDQNTHAFKEVAIIRHPRIGEYAFGFITSFVTLQLMFSNLQSYAKSLLGQCVTIINLTDQALDKWRLPNSRVLLICKMLVLYPFFVRTMLH